MNTRNRALSVRPLAWSVSALLLVVALTLALGHRGDEAAAPGEDRDRADAVLERHIPTSQAPGTRRAARGPVEIVAPWLGERAARMRLHFLKDANNVRVRIYGTDGLVVLSDEFPIADGSFLAGDERDLDVEHASSVDAHRNLVVQVEGSFAGRHRSMVRSFTIGPPSPARARELEVVEVEGRRVPIHRMRVREKR